MSQSFEKLKNVLKKMPGLGFKSAERIALHLALESKSDANELVLALTEASERISECPLCFGLSEDGELCNTCKDTSRDSSKICVVERASDISSIEKSGAWRGRYHVLGGKLSPLHKIGPEKLKFRELSERLNQDGVDEILLALSNDIEAEATCHYIRERIVGSRDIKITRIGFGLPSGSQLGFADSVTIKSALDARKPF